MEDRRRFKRFTYPGEVQWSGPTTSRFDRIGDLSTEGAYVNSADPASPGTIVTLTFCVGANQIDARAEVLHSKANRGMGVRFLNLSPEQRRTIERAFGKVRLS